MLGQSYPVLVAPFIVATCTIFVPNDGNVDSAPAIVKLRDARRDVGVRQGGFCLVSRMWAAAAD